MGWSLCPGTLCGYDVDDLFAYSTIKRVTIRDARLGILFYTLQFLIVVYILIYQLIWQGGYLAYAVPTNSVRVTLQQPTAVDGKPCNPNQASCLDNFTSPEVLPYCWAPHRIAQNVSGVSYKTLNCSYLEGTGVTALHGTSILMTTAVHSYTQQLNPECETSFGSKASPTCEKLWKAENDVAWYVVDPDQFTLLIDHTVTAPGIQVEPGTSKGYLYVAEGGNKQDRFCRDNGGLVDAWSDATATAAPCYVLPSKAGTTDYFHIGFLLDSIGMSLDEESPSSNAAQRELRRYSGMVVRIVIEYHNFRPFHLGVQSEVHYVYKLTALPGSTYKETRTINTHYPTQRVKEDLHGVLFQMQPGGSLASFSFTDMLIQLTTSLALLAVATTVVNTLAQYFLKYSPFYRKAMYTMSPDFSDLRAANALSDAELERELGRMGQRTGGDRVNQVMRLLAAGWSEALMRAEEAGTDAAAHVEIPETFGSSAPSTSGIAAREPFLQTA
mmetsp:Transcript_40669/g.93447  ORF Transcript_40669/g.93447 Transcript_40669/m.93447 type:complete len:498 (+) Transcript_40669:64-1557(+)